MFTRIRAGTNESKSSRPKPSGLQSRSSSTWEVRAGAMVNLVFVGCEYTGKSTIASLVEPWYAPSAHNPTTDPTPPT